MRQTRKWLLAALASAMLLTGCSLVPDSGPVVEDSNTANATPVEPPYVDPPGPVTGADRADIVKGFLLAMQANPISTATARTFLSEHARQTWRPDGGTVVYDASTVATTSDGVVLELSDAHRLDTRGSWSQRPTETRTVRLQLVREHGQWRIDNPPNALMVRSGYFRDQFVPFDLYFFDHSGHVLVPDPVYIARGQQTATNLVRSLLLGPDPTLASVVHTAFPATTLDLSVVVTDNGLAEVPLGPEVLKLSADEINRAMAQLIWTLRAVPGINRVRMTVAGTPVPLPDGRTDIGINEGAEFAPSGLGASQQLVAIHGGRVVTLQGGKAQPVSGGLGRRGYALRSLALDRAGDTVAAVSQDGSRAYVGPTVAGTDVVHRVFSGGADLLRPAYDVYGNLWLVDRTSRGAVVHVLNGGHDQVVDFPGISGTDVTSFAVSPDGGRLAVGINDGVSPRVLVATVQRTVSGGVQGGLTPIALPVTSYDPAHDLGSVIDVAWREPTLVAVLAGSDPGTSRIVYAMADGSPGDGEPPLPDAFTGHAASLVANSDPGSPMLLVDDRGRLSRLDPAGKWEGAGPLRLAGAAYAG